MGKNHVINLNLNQWFRKRCSLKKTLCMTDNRHTKTDHNSSPRPSAQVS